jgi:hypothetical protein
LYLLGEPFYKIVVDNLMDMHSGIVFMTDRFLTELMLIKEVKKIAVSCYINTLLMWQYIHDPVVSTTLMMFWMHSLGASGLAKLAQHPQIHTDAA